MSTANTPEEPPMTSSDPMEEYEETVEWIVALGVDRAAVEMSLAWAKPRIPTPGDHDKVIALAESITGLDADSEEQRALDGLIEALRTEQSARQAAERERNDAETAFNASMERCIAAEERERALIAGMRAIADGDGPEFVREFAAHFVAVPHE